MQTAYVVSKSSRTARNVTLAGHRNPMHALMPSGSKNCFIPRLLNHIDLYLTGCSRLMASKPTVAQPAYLWRCTYGPLGMHWSNRAALFSFLL
jgi:hypothetical protein